MIKKMMNKDRDFYSYLGKFFGSRLVQAKTKDRIYDDDNKIWYLFVEGRQVSALVSVSERVIKNVYATNNNNLIEVLNQIKKDISLFPSTVPLCYEDAYKEAGFKTTKLGTYKNFVLIRSDSITPVLN